MSNYADTNWIKVHKLWYVTVILVRERIIRRCFPNGDFINHQFYQTQILLIQLFRALCSIIYRMSRNYFRFLHLCLQVWIPYHNKYDTPLKGTPIVSHTQVFTRQFSSPPICPPFFFAASPFHLWRFSNIILYILSNRAFLQIYCFISVCWKENSSHDNPQC